MIIIKLIVYDIKYIKMSIILNIVEILVFLVCVLFSIAYLTVAERKTMGYMQRRLGPNAVGLKKKAFLNLHKNHIREFSTSTRLNNKTNSLIESLYLDREILPNKLDITLVDTCNNLLNSEERSNFLKKWKSVGGIYVIRYKNNEDIFYIGGTSQFGIRIKSHLGSYRSNSRFHTFARTIGWENFSFSIIEVCNENMFIERENIYLQKYLPLLNTSLSKSSIDLSVYDTVLYNKLEYKELDVVIEYKRKNVVPVYLYKLYDSEIMKNKSLIIKDTSNIYGNDPYLDKEAILYSNITNLSKELKIGKSTIYKYLNKNVPYRNNLFYTEPISNIEKVYNEIINTSVDLNLNLVRAPGQCRGANDNKVYCYCMLPENSLEFIFDSIEQVARYLNTSSKSIRDHINQSFSPPGNARWGKIESINDNYYLFNYKLNNYEINNIKKLSNKTFKNVYIVYIYDANTLDLIKGPFNSLQKAADYLNIDYKTVFNHLDTKLFTRQNNQLLYFFSYQLDDDIKFELKSNKKGSKLESKYIYVYIKDMENNFLKLINNNEPTYLSLKKASEDLKICHKTISKYSNKNQSYKGYYFYSKKIN